MRDAQTPVKLRQNTFSHGIDININCAHSHDRERRRRHVPHATAARLRRTARRRLLRGDDDERLPQFPAIFGLPALEVPRTVNGTGHTGPSEFCATSI